MKFIAMVALFAVVILIGTVAGMGIGYQIIRWSDRKINRRFLRRYPPK